MVKKMKKYLLLATLLMMVGCIDEDAKDPEFKKARKINNAQLCNCTLYARYVQ